MPQLQYNETKKKWYEKLKREGFEDIEQDEKTLKRWHSSYFICPSHGFRTIEKFNAQRDYYLQASKFLHIGTFNEKEYDVWELHAEGVSTREISRLLGIGRFPVWQMVKKMKEAMEDAMKGEAKKEDVLITRHRKPEDDNFIFNSLLNCLYFAGHWRSTRKVDGKHLPLMSREVAFKYRTVLSHVLAKPNVQCRVCSLKDDEDIIIGYSIVEKLPFDFILHFVYVREDWQRNGIARDLVPETPTLITHLTKDGRSVLSHLARKGIRPKLVSLPIAYEILENTFSPKRLEEENKNELRA